MSILNKPYEISVWNDVWDSDKGAFVEQKICVIGSDQMESQARVFSPQFTKNVNGCKKLSFKLYKNYVDTLTGEKVENPFVKELISERRIKLYLPQEPLGERWHDFVVKGISESSIDNLTTYHLEDAFVQELSKNGFSVVLDKKVFTKEGNISMSNMGTIGQLATKVLRETDWVLSPDSEVFTQTVEEPLVYLSVNSDNGISAKQLIDSVVTGDNSKYKIGIQEQDVNIPKGSIILGFYSSCTDKPYRFQFIYLPKRERPGHSGTYYYPTESVLRKVDSQIIAEPDCQYYIDLPTSSSYSDKENKYGFSLPTWASLREPSESNINWPTLYGSVDSAISSWYRGERYNFTQQSYFHPGLDRYVQKYKKNEGTDAAPQWQEYYGYVDTKYYSPALIQNLASSGDCSSSSGWTGTKIGTGQEAAVESVFGRFANKSFISSVDDLKNGVFGNYINDYKSYIKIKFNGSNSCVINSGPFDNRIVIENMTPNSEWATKITVRDHSGALLDYEKLPLTVTPWNCEFDGEKYISANKASGQSITFSYGRNEGAYAIYNVGSGANFTEETFKKLSKVRLKIAPKIQHYTDTVYVEALEFFKAIFDENHNLIVPDEQASSVAGLEDRTIDRNYYYVRCSDDALNTATKETILPTKESKQPLTEFIPVFNTGAQKIRSVDIKESNYFNILQSLAETFGAWLKLDVVHAVNGAVTSKRISFKNYVGKDNYAGFKYGVNLKDIQRTYESKNLVTKLIVKNNSNQYATAKSCTISRAAANPTGENYIYDFSYFHNTGLLDAKDFLNSTYRYSFGGSSATGPDLSSGTPLTSSNLQGYFPRLKNLNNRIQKETEILLRIKKDLNQYETEMALQEQLKEAGQGELETVIEEFTQKYLVPPDWVSEKLISNVILEDSKLEYDKPSWLDDDFTITQTTTSKGLKLTISAKAIKKTNENGEEIYDTSEVERFFYLTIYPTLTLTKGKENKNITQKYTGKFSISANSYTGSANFIIKPVDLDREDVITALTKYATLQNQITSANQALNNSTNGLTLLKKACLEDYTEQQEAVSALSEIKAYLNKLFYSKYYRFIQEGTWIDEKYVDDELYYNDARAVANNSCWPQVAYQVNTVELSRLPGYELFAAQIGDKTYIEDPEFFGEAGRQEVVVTEIVENLDDATETQIKIQNFKNQFKDLFQKITATVQQAQYNSGAYEKAVALAEAEQGQKFAFLSDALDSAGARLTIAGQQSVTTGVDGITVKSLNAPSDMVRIVGGAILLSKQDRNGRQKWVTGITSDGISASLITAGTLNTGEINIMSGSEPMFRWDRYGITAYDAVFTGDMVQSINPDRYVRFNKDGLYGTAEPISDVEVGRGEIVDKATFYLGWDGLKVSGLNNVQARIGKLGDNIIDVSKGNDPIFTISNTGKLYVNGDGVFSGTIYATSGKIGNVLIGDIASIEYVSQGDAETKKVLQESINSLNSAIEDLESTVDDLEGQIGDVEGGQEDVQSQLEQKINNLHTYFTKVLRVGKTVTGDNYVISPYISGGYLHITNGSSSITIDPLGHVNGKMLYITHDNNTLMSVDKDGNAEFAGKITTKDGDIGGWKITSNGLIKADDEGNMGTDGTFGVYPGGIVTGLSSDFNRVLPNNDAWVLTAGKNFGITKNGYLYANQGTFNSGKIGGWYLNEGRLGSDKIGLYTEELITGTYSESVVLQTEQKELVIDSINYKGSKYLGGKAVRVWQGEFPNNEGEMTFRVYHRAADYDETKKEYIYDIDFEPDECVKVVENQYAYAKYKSHYTDKFGGFTDFVISYNDGGTGVQQGGAIMIYLSEVIQTPVTTTETPTYFLAEDGYTRSTKGLLGCFDYSSEGLVIAKSDTKTFLLTPFGLKKIIHNSNGTSSMLQVSWETIFDRLG